MHLRSSLAPYPIPFVVSVLLGCGACSRSVAPSHSAPDPGGRAAALALASSPRVERGSPPTVGPAAETSSSAVVAEGKPTTGSKLRFVRSNDAERNAECSVIDEVSGARVGHATSRNTAAGGSTVECYDYLANGKIIRFANSRGIYAKDARLGATNDSLLPCGDGAFAENVTSCVALDITPQAYGEAERTAAGIPFDVNVCAVGSPDCTRLVTIALGLNRIGPKGQIPRWWDAKYCSDDRALVAANGGLSLFEVPSGKLLGKAIAPDNGSIVKCEGGVAEIRDLKTNETLSYKVDRSSIRRRGGSE